VCVKSLRELYRIGRGPSSSHTMGPETAAKQVRSRYPQADAFRVILCGSLALTGKGHLTDQAIREALEPTPVEIIWDRDTPTPEHPNTMVFIALRSGLELGRLRILSVGGGAIRICGEGAADTTPDVYPHNSFAEIADYCKTHSLRLWEYVWQQEGEGFELFLENVWNTMRQAVRRGLNATGTLSGGLNVERKAQILYRQHHMDETPQTRENRTVCAYAFAVSEENAGGGTIVTAPTCGSCGILPAVFCYQQEQRGYSDREILHALATGGIIGNLIKHNASISGAECGCQAEIGTACSMAAAALGELFGMDLDQIEYAAEVAMEHHLGLTCDPIDGLVQIPCIERNAVAAMRAINAVSLANFLTHSRKISFDLVVKTMYETGKDMSHRYRETSEGGLAKTYR